MKKILKSRWTIISLLVVGILALFTAIIVPVVRASQPRDYDTNAIIYGGAYSVSELNRKINNGTGKAYQSANQLKHFFNTLGIYQEQFGELSDGYVYKDGRVVVNGKVVYQDAKSYGRQYIAGSVKDETFKYPVYWRHTKHSFASDRIPAYAYMNQDGSFAYGIIKSCGNPVKGVGVKKPRVQTHKMEIRKFYDKNGDGKRQDGEAYMAGWAFRVTGENLDKTVKTDKNGVATIKDLKNGKYKVSEVQKASWKDTTGTKKTAEIKNGNVNLIFGNTYKEEKEEEIKFKVVAVKFEDTNGDGVHDEDEPTIPDWSVRLNGNGVNQEFLTKEDGSFTFDNLSAGEYTVTEEKKNGWGNTTPLVQTVTINKDNGDGYVEFGNQRGAEQIVTVKYVGNESLPVTGPIEMIAGSFAAIGLGGAGFMYHRSKAKVKNTFEKLKS